VAYAEHIELLREATDATACALREAPGKIVEKTLERAFNAALTHLSGRPCAQSRLALSNWNPQPGAFDSALGAPSAPEMVGEMKWSSHNKVFEVLWDAVKLCSAVDGPARTAFLAYGFPTRLWDKPVECADLFSPGQRPLVATIRLHIGWWEKYILADSAGWPCWAREYIVVGSVADETITYQGTSWVLRVVTVEGEGAIVPFEQGRPTAHA
jgi:hypothetical protein